MAAAVPATAEKGCDNCSRERLFEIMRIMEACSLAKHTGLKLAFVLAAAAGTTVDGKPINCSRHHLAGSGVFGDKAA